MLWKTINVYRPGLPPKKSKICCLKIVNCHLTIRDLVDGVGISLGSVGTTWKNVLYQVSVDAKIDQCFGKKRRVDLYETLVYDYQDYFECIISGVDT